MGVALAEVSPDLCFRFNTRCYRGAVFAAARRFRDCHPGGVHACGVGMGSIKRF